MKKIRYTDESIAHAMMLANLLAVRYAGSVNPDQEDVYRSAIALTSGLGLGQVTMGQIGDIVADIVAYHSDEGRAERQQKIADATQRLTDAENALRRARILLDNAAERVARCTESLNEIGRIYDLNEKQSFGADDFRFMK
jgi:DNA-directed RNA polymerase sigma subunit (sigma70/sigma32)